MEQYNGSKRRGAKIALSFLGVIFSIVSLNSCGSSNKLFERKNEELTYHLKILDSVMAITAEDSIYCCPQSIIFMEKQTGIDASSDGTTFGKLFFTREDLKKWHVWESDKKRKNK